jgi:hypothetical protein
VVILNNHNALSELLVFHEGHLSLPWRVCFW